MSHLRWCRHVVDLAVRGLHRGARGHEDHRFGDAVALMGLDTCSDKENEVDDPAWNGGLACLLDCARISITVPRGVSG